MCCGFWLQMWLGEQNGIWLKQNGCNRCCTLWGLEKRNLPEEIADSSFKHNHTSQQRLASTQCRQLNSSDQIIFLWATGVCKGLFQTD